MSDLQAAVAGRPGWSCSTGVARYTSTKTRKTAVLGWVARENAYGWQVGDDEDGADSTAYLDDAIGMVELEANR
jgi:hypothetical protein